MIVKVRHPFFRVNSTYVIVIVGLFFILTFLCGWSINLLGLLIEKVRTVQYYWMHEPGFAETGAGSATGDGITGFDESINPTITVNFNNIPFVAWTRPEKSAVFVAYEEAGVWHQLPVLSNGAPNEASASPAIAFAPDNTLYITWSQGSSIYLGLAIK